MLQWLTAILGSSTGASRDPTAPIAVPISLGSGDVVGEPCEGGAAHGEVGVLVAPGGQWLDVAEDGLDESAREVVAGGGRCAVAGRPH